MTTTQANVHDFGRPLSLGKVEQLPAKIKKMVTTDEGKLQITLEADALDTETIQKIKGLLEMQQGLTLIDFTPTQADLFN